MSAQYNSDLYPLFNIITGDVIMHFPMTALDINDMTSKYLSSVAHWKQKFTDLWLAYQCQTVLSGLGMDASVAAVDDMRERVMIAITMGV
jgi:hypothetical protein